MKRIFVLTGLFFATLTAFAQTGAVQNHCYLGGTKATTSGLQSANYLNGIIPGCSVTVYVHGTNPPQKATITSDGSTPLANPFIANMVPSVDPGGWLFFAATSQGLDITMSGGNGNPACNTAPLCYTQTVTLTDIFPSGSFTPVSGVTSINGVQGAFNFTGGVNCSGTNCNFTGATLQHNGTNLPSQLVLNFLDTPANLNPSSGPDPGFQPVVFKNDTHGGLAAETAASGSQFSAYLIPPTTGQYVNLCSGTQSGSGSDSSQIFTSSPCAGAVTAIGGPIGAPHSASVTWSNYTLPSYVNPANVSAVYAVIMMRAQSSGIGSWTFVCNAQNVGTTSVTTTRQFNSVLVGINGSNINTVSCTVSAAHSGGNANTFTYVNATVELFAFYTGTAPPAVNQVNIQPPLNWDSSVGVLSLDVPPDNGTDSGTANNYQVTMPGAPLFIPGLTVKFTPGNNSTSATPTLIVNGVLSGTIKGPRGGTLSSGDLSTSAVATVILGPDANWWLQNPQVSGAPGAVNSVSNSDGTLTCSPTTGSVVCSIATAHANTWSANQTFTGPIGVDASGATQWKAPVAAGCASAANGEFCFDSTNANWHFWNGADRLMVPLASGFVSGHCGEPTATGNKWEIVDAGGACGTGSGGDNITSPNSTITVGGTSTNTTLDVAPVNTVVDTSTPVTVTTTKPAEFHFNENATAATAVTYNLPTAAAGKQFCFANANNGSAANTGILTIATSASGQFIIFTDGTLSATGGNVTSGGAAADGACVVGVDSTHWFLYVQAGTWTKH